jgi:hypothetical protein
VISESISGRVKASRSEADHSHPFSVDIKSVLTWVKNILNYWLFRSCPLPRVKKVFTWDNVKGAYNEMILHMMYNRQNSIDLVTDVGNFEHYIMGYLSMNISKAFFEGILQKWRIKIKDFTSYINW